MSKLAPLLVLLVLFCGCAREYSVHATPSGSGTVSGSGAYKRGAAAHLEARPRDGYVFIGWHEQSQLVSGDPQYSFRVSGSRNLTAVFEPARYQVLVWAQGHGQVSGGDVFGHADLAIVEAEPDYGQVFVGWYLDGKKVSAKADYRFTVLSNRALTARFMPQTYAVTVKFIPHDGGTYTSSGNHSHGANLRLTAHANSGFVFSHWQLEGETFSKESSFSTDIEGDLALEAHFAALHRIELLASSGGRVSLEGEPFSGNLVTAQAVAQAGFMFVNWTEAGRVVSSAAAYRFSVVGDRMIIANFMALKHSWLPVDGTDLLAWVTKESYLGSYVPGDLVSIPTGMMVTGKSSRQLRGEALERLQEMVAAAGKEGVSLAVSSAYRSYSTQKNTFETYVRRYGSEEEANRHVARPGQSEHQLGTTVDFGGTGVDFTDAFGKTAAGRWLAANAHSFGFVMSYPPGSEHVTGYKYEPWHFRYIGTDAASACEASGLVPSEYIRTIVLGP